LGEDVALHLRAPEFSFNEGFHSSEVRLHCVALVRIAFKLRARHYSYRGLAAL
jgi:hypothetical protein